MSIKDKSDQSLELDDNSDNTKDLVNDDVKVSASKKHKEPTGCAGESENNNQGSASKSSFNNNDDHAHIVLDGASLKGIEALLSDLIVERKKTRRKGWFTRLLFIVALLTIIFFNFAKTDNLIEAGPHTALVKLNGVIMPGGEINAELALDAINAAMQNKQTKGLIIQINSPGGSPVQSQKIYEGIKQAKLRHDKPVAVVIDDVGASGGYYIAAAADNIYASRASIVGSIGVRVDSFGVTELMDKIGVESRTITAGKYKSGLDPFSKPSAEVNQHLQTMIEGVHQQFINAVEQGRSGKLNGDKSTIYSGLFWNGEQAYDLGLIDGFKSPRVIAKEDMNAANIIDYTVELDYLSQFTKGLGVSITNQFYRLFSATNLQ